MKNEASINKQLATHTLDLDASKTLARSLWVDYAKAIGIILVVYAHVARGAASSGLYVDQGTYTLIDSVIYSFHMPLFFFISGVFLLASMSKRSPMSLLRNKVDTILYPYVVWSLLQGFLEVALHQYVNGEPTAREVLSLIWAPRAQFWFLYVLFFTFALAILLFRKSSYMWSIGIFLGSIILNLYSTKFAAGYLINTVSHFFVYFAFGVFSTFIMERFQGHGPRLLILFAALFAASQWAFHIQLGLHYNSTDTFKTLPLGLISIGFVIILAQWLTRFNLPRLAYLGRNSMTIYLVHIIAGSGCRIVLHKVFGITDDSIHLVIGTLGGLLLPLLFYHGCMRFGFSALFSPPQSLAIGRRQT